jgi:CHAT domain-containing protein
LVRVFHFAGHAIVGPSRTGLVLASAGKKLEKDVSPIEFLDASRIRKLAIPRADLVVLSSCATAGDEGGLGDPQNLVRAFLRAGVPHVVATRWNVDSHSTVALMQEFYNRLLHGEPPAAALRSASEMVRQNRGTAHPYYWAAFTAFGRD